MYGLQQSIFTEIQTVTVTYNWLDSFIDSVTIYSVGKGPHIEVMGYITIKSFFLALLHMESIFFSLGGGISIKSVIGSSVLETFLVLEPGTCRTRHPLGLPLEICSLRYSYTTSLFGSGVFYWWTSAPWLCISCSQSVCPPYLSPSKSCCFETGGRKTFRQFSIFFKSVSLYVHVLIGLVSVCQKLTRSSLQTTPADFMADGTFLLGVTL